MSDKYSESILDGTSYIASNRFTITTPYDGNPVINIRREKRFLLDGNIINSDYDTITEEFRIEENENGPANVSEEVQLRNPATGALTGSTMSYAEIYGVLYSVFFHMSEKADNPS